MPKRRSVKAGDLAGLFIYQEPKNRTVFYDILSRKGYLLTNNDVKMYTIYTVMLPVCALLTFGVMSLFQWNGFQALIFFIVSYLAAMLLFRVFWFWKLPVQKNFNPSAGGSIIASLAEKYSKQRLTILLVMLIGLDILMPVYGITAELDTLSRYVLYGVTAFTVLGTLVVVAALLRQKKNG